MGNRRLSLSQIGVGRRRCASDEASDGDTLTSGEFGEKSGIVGAESLFRDILLISPSRSADLAQIGAVNS